MFNLLFRQPVSRKKSLERVKRLFKKIPEKREMLEKVSHFKYSAKFRFKEVV